jgi:hypothetical protein
MIVYALPIGPHYQELLVQLPKSALSCRRCILDTPIGLARWLMTGECRTVSRSRYRFGRGSTWDS